MAKRPSVQEILELARKGGAFKPTGETPAPAAPAEASAEPVAPAEAPAESVAPAAAVAPPPSVPTAASLGRPLTLQEKLAAARAGGAAKPAGSAPAAAKPVAVVPAASAPTTGGAKTVPPPAPSVGRPLTLAEKLAAARSGGSAATAAAGATATPAAKPVAAKAAPATKPAKVERQLPPLDKITDPKDLAEALRQTGAKKAKEVEAATAKAAPAAKPAKEKESKPTSVLPRPTRDSVRAAATYTRRAVFSVTGLLWLGWGAFTIGCVQLTAMCGRFMFPNVLAEPPSTIKVGPPSNFEPEAVNERFKAEWGFWIVRSTRYNGSDIIYAIQSVCTHLGCPPNWLAGEQKFKCPCHGSGFYISGVNFEGPAPRPLERFKLVTADDGQLVVDKSQKFQEELGQWSDPESYFQA